MNIKVLFKRVNIYSFLCPSINLFISVEFQSKLKTSLQYTLAASQVVQVVKKPPANAGDVRDTGSIPGSGRSPGGGHRNPLQSSCLKNSMDRGVWWVTVHRVAKSRTQLKRLTRAQYMQSLTRIQCLFTVIFLLM